MVNFNHNHRFGRDVKDRKDGIRLRRLEIADV